MKICSERVRIEMARKCMSTRQLSEIIGLSPSAVNETLRRGATRAITVGKLAAALGVDVTEIMESA